MVSLLYILQNQANFVYMIFGHKLPCFLYHFFLNNNPPNFLAAAFHKIPSI